MATLDSKIFDVFAPPLDQQISSPQPEVTFTPQEGQRVVIDKKTWRFKSETENEIVFERKDK